MTEYEYGWHFQTPMYFHAVSSCIFERGWNGRVVFGMQSFDSLRTDNISIMIIMSKDKRWRVLIMDGANALPSGDFNFAAVTLEDTVS